MRSNRIETRRVFAQMVALACLAGCSGSKPSNESADVPETIAECDAYVASLSKCLKRSGSQVEESTADARIALQARFAAAAGDPSARERVRAKCAEGQKILASSCR